MNEPESSNQQVAARIEEISICLGIVGLASWIASLPDEWPTWRRILLALLVLPLTTLAIALIARPLTALLRILTAAARPGRSAPANATREAEARRHGRSRWVVSPRRLVAARGSAGYGGAVTLSAVVLVFGGASASLIVSYRASAPSLGTRAGEPDELDRALPLRRGTAASGIESKAIVDSDRTLKAWIGVANATRGDAAYGVAVDAAYDEVVKVEVVYENISTRTIDVTPSLKSPKRVASGFLLRVDLASDDHRLGGDAFVKLDRPDAVVGYIAHSGVWKHLDPVGTFVETRLPDAPAVSSLSPLQTLRPGEEASASWLFRIFVPGVSIRVTGHGPQSAVDVQEFTVHPGDDVLFVTTVENSGNTRLRQITVGNRIPPMLEYVSGTTEIFTAGRWRKLADGIVDPRDPTGRERRDRGIPAPDLAPGRSFELRFVARLPRKATTRHKLRDVAWVRPIGLNVFYNTAVLNVVS